MKRQDTDNMKIKFQETLCMFRKTQTLGYCIICLAIWIALYFAVNSFGHIGDFQRILPYEEIDLMSRINVHEIEALNEETKVSVFPHSTTRGWYVKIRGNPIERRISSKSAKLLRERGVNSWAVTSASNAAAFYFSFALTVVTVLVWKKRKTIFKVDSN